MATEFHRLIAAPRALWPRPRKKPPGLNWGPCRVHLCRAASVMDDVDRLLLDNSPLGGRLEGITPASRAEFAVD